MTEPPFDVHKKEPFKFLLALGLMYSLCYSRHRIHSISLILEYHLSFVKDMMNLALDSQLFGHHLFTHLAYVVEEADYSVGLNCHIVYLIQLL